MFFLLYRQNDIDKIIEGNYQNYVTDKLTCEIACESIRFSFALRHWGRFTRGKIPPRETSPAPKSEGETDAFAGYV